MRTFLVALLGIALSASHASAADDAKKDSLIICGPETVAVFEGTTSPDGHYALGWTPRPHPGKPPVDWSDYKSDEASVWVGKYDSDEGSTGDGYTLLDGVLDLRVRQFIPFKSDLPYWPHKNHAGMDIAWSGEQHGSRFAVVNNDARFYTAELWLIEINATGVHITDIAPAAYRITRPYLRKHVAKNYDGLAVAFSAGGGAPPDAFTDGKLHLHFDAEVPKSILEQDGCSGTLTVALPSGKMLGISGR